MGAGSLDYKEMAQQIELATGGLSVSAHICSHHTDPNTYEQVCPGVLVLITRLQDLQSGKKWMKTLGFVC